MQHLSRISAFVATAWRNPWVGVVSALYGVLLGDASIFRHDPAGRRLLAFAVCLLVFGGLVVLAAIAHALWSALRPKRPGGAA